MACLPTKPGPRQSDIKWTPDLEKKAGKLSLSVLHTDYRNAMPLQDLAPTSVSINGQLCSVQLNITLSNVVTPTTDTTADFAAAAVEQSTVSSRPGNKKPAARATCPCMMKMTEPGKAGVIGSCS